jgi:hypothetical protein
VNSVFRDTDRPVFCLLSPVSCPVSERSESKDDDAIVKCKIQDGNFCDAGEVLLAASYWQIARLDGLIVSPASVRK